MGLSHFFRVPLDADSGPFPHRLQSLDDNVGSLGSYPVLGSATAW